MIIVPGSNQTHDQNCTNCGFPIKGSSEEQQKFISLKGWMKHEVKELRTKIENVANHILCIIRIVPSVGVISYFTVKDKELSLNVLIENLILCTIFLALGGWAKSKSVICILSGLIFYIISQIIGVVGGYTGPLKGILMKGIMNSLY